MLWLLVLVFTFSIPLSQYLSMRLLGLVFLISIFRLKFGLILRNAWDIMVYLIVIVIGLSYSEDYFFGLGVLETLLSLLLIPIALSAFEGTDEDKLSILLTAFISGTSIGSLACIIASSVNYFQTGSTDVYLYYGLTGLLDFQPTYYAYYLVFSISSGLYLIYFRKTPVPAKAIAIVILFLFMILLLTGGRTAFISMLLVCAFFVLKFLVERGRGSQRLTFGLVLVIIAGLFATTYWVGDTTAFSDTWDRYDLWTSAIHANTEIMWGVGTGDFKAVLNNYFLTHDMDHYASESLNAHNQFIQTYLSNGTVGLVALLIMIFRPLYLAFRQDNALTILILFPFLIYGMTEVFLGRYQGVVFFALIHQIFTSHLLSGVKPAYTNETI